MSNQKILSAQNNSSDIFSVGDWVKSPHHKESFKIHSILVRNNGNIIALSEDERLADNIDYLVKEVK